MEHISQLAGNVREQTALPDILVISRSFLPKEAIIGEYIYNRCLQDPERVIVLAASCSGDQAFDRVQKFPIYRWPILRDWSFFNPLINLIYSFALAIKLYFRYRYRYIEWGHGYEFPSLLLLSYFLPIRFFIYLHGNDIVCGLRNPLWRSLFKLTLKRAEGIVCNSSFTQDYLRTRLRLDTPTHVINPMVRADKFSHVINPGNLGELRANVRQMYNIPETAVVILSVGKLVKHKSFNRIIDNLPLLLTVGVDVHYIICGQGPCEAELKSLANRLRVDQRVHFAGEISDRELGGYYAACDIFAMLNLVENKASTMEGFGIVYLEASYFGKPVIASRLGGVIDAIHHEENGILVNPYSGYEVFQAFNRLCKDQQLREQLGRKGKELAKRKTLHRSLYKLE
ncbi:MULTISPECIES: glycosyltransferase family 4 protein [unclassified Tolypothrix]|uniref:glycosyltransferase family 4 protein n=1 Tax=unclassified Tolypothrix TaxID=2649714 RepID=UPI0005EAB6B3|nr:MULTISPECIES: glycosyltransferase family 4 protein [unclassified Tolypothrix]BAY88214.1 group 1 glycosyl transferase [Microchaete diplosiphon NIES-3275]EKF02083.1 glycosyltransferase, group 1 family [Tolypothrix sp. PCC 7601]MBE9087930.1 glycosyltransferase family 4 protein [Tolypothrix sp. LEGE 11397]UYD28917.1 glycosyltransferase family 4 protein [Tolypothrix sp. PCC 7712]UYD35170.1 glycosyltransferase family 4 protein [Tolypothrix sp. PCC 7601]